jgi:hypothetical protein
MLYIDHLDKEEEIKFATALATRISRINSELKIITFENIKKSQIDYGKNKELIINAIDNSFITISLITETYLDYLIKDKEFSDSINRIINSKDRYIFPIIFSETNWIKSEWLIKSKLYPSSSSIIDLNSNEQDIVIAELIKNVEAIIKTPSQKNQVVNTQKTLVNKISSDTVFISHSHNDADFAELLKLKLEKENINAWLDNERLKIGQNWREEIDEGIKTAKAIIVIVSPDSKESEYVTYEWAYAWGNGKKIFPIMLKKTQLHPRLESLQYLDFTNRIARPWEDLIESIRKIKT